jgi:DNA-3-methyladenine glycosylase
LQQEARLADQASIMRFFDRPAELVARELLGTTLLFSGAGGFVVETEAYDPSDPASHSFPGPTPRNQVMFGPPAHAYVYRSYGIHWCLNFVCRNASAVLIRAIEPTEGLGQMRQRRGLEDVRALCSGPGKLAQALGITGEDNGKPLYVPPFSLELSSHNGKTHIGRRIGITKAVDTPWRFGVHGSKYLSKRFAEGE